MVVKSRKYCWTKVKMSSIPVTTKSAMVRLSFQGQVGPAKVKTMVKDTMAPVAKMKPAQSRERSFVNVERWWSPPGLTFGSQKMYAGAQIAAITLTQSISQRKSSNMGYNSQIDVESPSPSG